MALSIAQYLPLPTTTHYCTMKQAFLITLLWSSSDDEGEPLDREYSISDIDDPDNAIDRVLCQFKSMVEADPVLINLENIVELTGNDYDRIAHDLCLTINCHGAGFWDGDYSPDRIGSGIIGDRLTAISHYFTKIGLYANSRDRLSIEQY